jgi:DNA-binding XRE family transcriptional regulator
MGIGPEFSMVLGQFQRVGHSAFTLGDAKGSSREQKSTNDAHALHQRKPVLPRPADPCFHPIRCSTDCGGGKRGQIAGMSALARSSRARGMRMMRSPGPQPDPAGRLDAASGVMSAPMMAKSPSAISRMSGQLLAQKLCSGEEIPSRRVNMRLTSQLGSNMSNRFWQTAWILAKPTQIHPDALKAIQSLAKERKRRKMSRYRLSQISGVSQQMIGYMEKGERIPSLDVACRIANGLGLSFSLERGGE